MWTLPSSGENKLFEMNENNFVEVNLFISEWNLGYYLTLSIETKETPNIEPIIEPNKIKIQEWMVNFPFNKKSCETFKYYHLHGITQYALCTVPMLFYERIKARCVFKN